MNPKALINLERQRFNRLLVIKRAGRTKHYNATWLCICDCGKEVIVASGNLRSGNSGSCGCLNYEITLPHLLKTAKMDKRGNKNPCWRGGTTPLNALIRSSKSMAEWRKAVFERDNYTCVWCGQIGDTLNADHIKPFALYPELRFDINNGRTLCLPCHKLTNTYAGRGQKRNHTRTKQSNAEENSVCAIPKTV